MHGWENWATKFNIFLKCQAGNQVEQINYSQQYIAFVNPLFSTFIFGFEGINADIYNLNNY